MDVTDQTSIDQAVKHIQATEGRLNILVNNYILLHSLRNFAYPTVKCRYKCSHLEDRPRLPSEENGQLLGQQRPLGARDVPRMGRPLRTQHLRTVLCRPLVPRPFSQGHRNTPEHLVRYKNQLRRGVHQELDSH